MCKLFGVSQATERHINLRKSSDPGRVSAGKLHARKFLVLGGGYFRFLLGARGGGGFGFLLGGGGPQGGGSANYIFMGAFFCFFFVFSESLTAKRIF